MVAGLGAALVRYAARRIGLREVLEARRERVREVEHSSGRIIPWLFCRHDGSRIGDFRKAWAAACRAAGVPGRLMHDFRRTAVRNLERAGVPRSAAMKLTGHKTEAVFRRYAITDAAMLQEATVKLAALHAAETNGQSSGKVSAIRTDGDGVVIQKSVDFG
jgi:integrase